MVEIKNQTFKNIINTINDSVTGDVLANLTYSSMIMIYFIVLNIQYEAVSGDLLSNYINISSMIFLMLSIGITEIAYRKESTSTLTYGIEFLILAIFTLLIRHIPKLINCNMQTYMLIGSYLFAIYYMLKTSILYTIERRQQLKELSDIKEIIKEDPTKKEAKRKNKKKEEV